jgi:hypothetical protein
MENIPSKHKGPLKLPLLIFAACLLSLSCGGNANLLRAISPSDQILTYDNYAESARVAYDNGQFEKAWLLGTKAYQLNPGSESISILLSYIALSLAGGDPFGLAKTMVEANKAKSDGNPISLTTNLSHSENPSLFSTQNYGDLSSTTSTSSTLASLQKAIGLTNEEIEKMGDKDSTDPDLPLLKPKCVEILRREMPRFIYLDQAIRLTCPFIDPDVRLKSDYRQECEPFDGPRNQENKAHFLWAFAHLTEALAFNTILTYGTGDPNGSKSNLELRAERIRGLPTNTPESLDRFLSAVKGLESTVDAVLPRTAICSMAAPTPQLRATLNDLLAVSAGFAKLKSIPQNMVASIRTVTEKLNSSGDSFQTIRSDFTKKTSENLTNKVEELAKDKESPLSPEQKSALCSSLSSIGGHPLPDACKTSPN